MTQIGSGRAAGAIIGDLKATVAKAMDAARQKIAAATTELTAEINDGSAAVGSALHREVLAVRQEFSEITGNGPAPDTDESRFTGGARSRRGSCCFRVYTPTSTLVSLGLCP